MKVNAVLNTARTLLNDDNKVRWADADILEGYNAARRAIVDIRPLANTIIAPVTLVAGIRQSIPSDGIAFVSLPNTLNEDGLTIEQAVVECNKSDMDAVLPTWPAVTAGPTVNFMRDPQNAKNYYVYPQSDGTLKASLQYAQIPPEVAIADIASTDLDLDESYIEPICHYIRSHAYAVNTEEGSDTSMQKHYTLFLQSMGVKVPKGANNG